LSSLLLLFFIEFTCTIQQLTGVLDGYNGKQVLEADQDMVLNSRQQQKTRIWCRQWSSNDDGFAGTARVIGGRDTVWRPAAGCGKSAKL
jgi:hypothetical protein